MAFFTFQDLTTTAGATAAAAAIVTLIQILKAAAPGLFARFTGAAWVVFLTLALYIAGAVLLTAAPPDGFEPMDANSYLAFFLSWLGCATAAIGIYVGATSGIQFVRTDMYKRVIGPNEEFAEDTPNGLNSPPKPPIA